MQISLERIRVKYHACALSEGLFCLMIMYRKLPEVEYKVFMRKAGERRAVLRRMPAWIGN
jgi:hypothetical protein